jgi:glycosyltransferase involved in cell wall biosynthesis
MRAESKAAVLRSDVRGKAPAPAGWPGLGADIEAFGGAAEGPARVAIVSYEFVGMVRNGGIGTACTELGLALARDGHAVDLFFTGWGEDPSEEGFDRLRARYRDQGVGLHRLDLEDVSAFDTLFYNSIHSLALYRALKDRDRKTPFDAIHFVESLGHGFYSLLAKRQGLAFARATSVVWTHSPRRWLAEAHGFPFDNPIELGDEFLERRSLELADVVISPSAHMLDWLVENGVSLPQRSYVQQYVNSIDREAPSRRRSGPVREIVFFGRLEPRKGINAFCEALDLLAEEETPGLDRVTFLGKESIPASHLYKRADSWPWRCEVVSDLHRDEALAYLRKPGRLAVMASTMDNSPNTVYEAIGLGIDFLASRSGGTGELVAEEDLQRVTYDPGDPELREIDPGNPERTRPVQTGRVLAARLREVLKSDRRPARFAIAPEDTRKTHLAWHRTVRAERSRSQPAELSGSIPIEKLAGAAGRGWEIVLVYDAEVETHPELGAKLAEVAGVDPDAAFLTPLGRFDVENPEGGRERLFLPTGGPASTGLLANCAGAGVALARIDALERIGAFDDGDGAPRSVSELLARGVVEGERVDVVPEVLFRMPAAAAPNSSIAHAQDPLEILRPYLRAFTPRTRDIAAIASRLYREEVSLRLAAQQTEGRVAELSAQVADLTSSRSMRLTAPLRRAGAAARRLRERLRR